MHTPNPRKWEMQPQSPLSWICRGPWAHPSPTLMWSRHLGASGYYLGKARGCFNSSLALHTANTTGCAGAEPAAESRALSSSHKPPQRFKISTMVGPLKFALWAFTVCFFGARRVHVPKLFPVASTVWFILFYLIKKKKGELCM